MRPDFQVYVDFRPDIGQVLNSTRVINNFRFLVGSDDKVRPILRALAESSVEDPYMVIRPIRATLPNSCIKWPI